MMSVHFSCELVIVGKQTGMLKNRNISQLVTECIYFLMQVNVSY